MRVDILSSVCVDNPADLPHWLSSARTGVVETARLPARRCREHFSAISSGKRKVGGWERRGEERETCPDT